MNRSEVLGVLSVLKAAYPNFYRGMARKDAEDAVNIWCDIFQDDPAVAVGKAVREYIAEDSKGYPPSPGQLKTKLPKSGLRAIIGFSLTGRDLERWKKQKKLLAKYNELKRRRLEAGIPVSWEEAKKVGLKAEEYVRIIDEAGLGVEAIL